MPGTGINAGIWLRSGDAFFVALADSGRPIVLATVELPMLVKQLLENETGCVTLEGKRAAAGSFFL